MISTGGYLRKQGRLRRHRAAVAATHVLSAYPSGMSPVRATTRVAPTVAIYKGLRGFSDKIGRNNRRLSDKIGRNNRRFSDKIGRNDGG